MADDYVSLKEHFEVLLKQRDVEFRDYKESERQQKEIASKQIDARLEKLNELRQEVVRDRGIYLSRTEYEAKHDSLGQRFRPLEEKLATLERWQNKVIGIGIVLVLLAGAVGGLIGKVLSR